MIYRFMPSLRFLVFYKLLHWDAARPVTHDQRFDAAKVLVRPLSRGMAYAIAKSLEMR